MGIKMKDTLASICPSLRDGIAVRGGIELWVVCLIDYWLISDDDSDYKDDERKVLSSKWWLGFGADDHHDHDDDDDAGWVWVWILAEQEARARVGTRLLLPDNKHRIWFCNLYAAWGEDGDDHAADVHHNQVHDDGNVFS